MFKVTGLGDRLKEARTAKGFTLDDLQAITKIQKRYLANIENEQYDSMPGAFYVRAFIKQYAEAVGLDADEMLALYKETPETKIPEEVDRKLPPSPLSRRNSAKRSSELNKIMPKIIVALFIVVIIVVVWLLSQKSPANNNTAELESEKPITVQKKPSSNNDKEVIVKDENQEDEQEDGQEDVEEKRDSEEEPVEQTLENSRIDGQNAIYTLSGASDFKLEIRTSAASWIGILDAVGQERMPEGADTMNAGDTVEVDVSDTESVRIRVGNYTAAEIYVNGELLEYAIERIPQNVFIEYKKEQ